MKRLFSTIASLLLAVSMVSTNVSAINLVPSTSVTTRKSVEIIT